LAFLVQSSSSQLFVRSDLEAEVRLGGQQMRGAALTVGLEVAAMASTAMEPSCVEKLAQLFPGVSAVRIPVRVSTAVMNGRRRLEEQTVIEFGTAREVLFSSTLPLEFEDPVRVENSDGSLDTRATVVAVRYHNGGKAVAVRFLGEVENWIIKP
jgi:hypothetical protein